MTYFERLERLASIVGGQTRDLGPDGTFVLWTRPDGKTVADGIDLLAVYDERGIFEDAGDPSKVTRSLVTDPRSVPRDHCERVASIVGGHVVRQRESGDIVVWTRSDGACVVLGPDRLEVYATEDALSDGSRPVASLDRGYGWLDDAPARPAACPECRCEPGQGVTPGCAACARYVAAYGPAV